MARAPSGGTQTLPLTQAWTKLFDSAADGGACRSFEVEVISGTTIDLQVIPVHFPTNQTPTGAQTSRRVQIGGKYECSAMEQPAAGAPGRITQVWARSATAADAVITYSASFANEKAGA